jgi:peptide/nickel transport system ATP-binding protein
MGEPILQIRNLKKYYEIKQGLLAFRAEPIYVKAVDDVTFTINKGEIYGLVGESGCGKTTTGRCIARLEDPTDGSILFRDVDIAKIPKKELRAFRKNVQMIFQDPYESLNPRFTVFQAVADPLTVHAREQNPEERLDAVVKALDDAGLKNPQDLLERFPHELSGGQRQRVAIARALVVDPKFIVADEPVSMLDISIRAGVMNLMLDIKDRLQIAYLFVTHDVAIARYMSDNLGVMYLGHIVESASTDELINNATHPYTRALLSAVPIPDPDYEWVDVPIKGDIPSPINLPKGCRFNPRCVWARDICRETSPETIEVATGHFVKCHFAADMYGNEAPLPVPAPESMDALQDGVQPEEVTEDD